MAVNNIGSVYSNPDYVYSTTKSSSETSMNMQDFLTLVVAQMQNQDMYSAGQDNGEFMSQMAQIASMQAMQELTAAFMSSVSVNLMGKYVQAEAVTNTGEFVQAEGFVDRINFNGGDTMVLIDGIWFRSSDIYQISLDKPSGANSEGTDTTGESE